jgi:hypothetical protein
MSADLGPYVRFSELEVAVTAVAQEVIEDTEAARDVAVQAASAAQTAQGLSEEARDASAASALAASGSASAASGSASAAAGSAGAASGSASAANSSAFAASGSASAASGSASAALASEQAADGYAQAADASAIAASGSASAAAGSASAASGSASAASGSASAASGSASAALASEQAAAASALAAAGSASTATAQAVIATTQASLSAAAQAFLDPPVLAVAQRMASAGGVAERGLVRVQSFLERIQALSLPRPSFLWDPVSSVAGTSYAVIPEDGAGDLTVTRAAIGTRHNRLGTLVDVANNVPRLDFDPITGVFRGVIIEPTVTSFAPTSEDFASASWDKQEVTVGTSVTSPRGTATAQPIVPSTNNAGQAITHTTTRASGVWTSSIHAQAAGYSHICLIAYINTTNWVRLTFNVTTGALTETLSGAGSTFTALTARPFQTAGFGYLRLGMSFNSAASNFAIGYAPANSATPAAGDFGWPTYAGDGTSGVRMFGAGLVAGSVMRSYVPVAAASATKDIDVISGSNAQVDQLLGTVFAVWLADDESREKTVFHIGSALSNGIACFENEANRRLQVRAGSTSSGTNSGAPPNAGLINTVAVTYTQSECSIFLNSVFSHTISHSGTGAMNVTNIGSRLAASGPTRAYGSYFLYTAIFRSVLSTSQIESLHSIFV